ncbi:MAG: S8 family peptidase [Candidatus Marinimicrobia bacterium]|nr:S8 family peptidase [Candidatus Neomarinimicrobiota bacterium]
MKKILILLTLSVGFSGEINLSQFSPGFRENGLIKTWVYFQDKMGSPIIALDERRKNQRQAVGLSSEPTFYDQKISPNYMHRLNELGINIIHQSRWLNAVSVLVTPTELNQLNNLVFVKKIEPVYFYHREKLGLSGEVAQPNSSRDDSLDYGYAQDQIEQINVHMAHQNGYYGQGIRVLVMDTGFDLSHSVFDSLTLIAQHDFINDDNFTGNETDDENYYNQDFHGTAVLSVMAGNQPGSLIGPAFKSEYLLAKTEMVEQEIQGEEDNYVAGLEWGEANGAQVVSTSLGYLDWYTYEDLDGNTAVTTNAIDIAVGLGLTCVTAAGNEGNSSWYYIISPADADSVIAVGAVNVNDVLATFSSHGPTFDGRIKPEVCARGVSTWGIDPGTNGYRTLNGTSLATPLVGGAVAVIKSAHPDWAPMTLRSALLMSADNHSNPNNSYGYGIIDTWGAINFPISSTDGFVHPSGFNLLSNYPNPFNPITTIRFDLVETWHVGNPAVSGATSLRIFDITGRVVDVLVNGNLNPGQHEIQWNASQNGSGIYFVQLQTENRSITNKMIYLK